MLTNSDCKYVAKIYDCILVFVHYVSIRFDCNQYSPMLYDFYDFSFQEIKRETEWVQCSIYLLTIAYWTPFFLPYGGLILKLQNKI